VPREPCSPVYPEPRWPRGPSNFFRILPSHASAFSPTLPFRVRSFSAYYMDLPQVLQQKTYPKCKTLLNATLTKNRGVGVTVNPFLAGFNIPTCNSHSGTQSPLCTTIVLALSFHSLTNCPFSIPFVLTFIHRMGGVGLLPPAFRGVVNPPASRRKEIRTR